MLSSKFPNTDRDLNAVEDGHYQALIADDSLLTRFVVNMSLT